MLFVRYPFYLLFYRSESSQTFLFHSVVLKFPLTILPLHSLITYQVPG